MYPKGKYYIFDEKIKTYIYYIEFFKNHFLLLYTTGQFVGFLYLTL